MKIKDNRAYYRISFADWLVKNHPDIKLSDWQIKVVNILLNKSPATGKTVLIKLLSEYDLNASYN